MRRRFERIVLLRGRSRHFLCRWFRGRFRRRWGCGFSAAIGGFLEFLFVTRFFGCGFGVGNVTEHLQTSRVLFRGEDAVLLVDGYADKSFELAGHFSMPLTDEGQ